MDSLDDSFELAQPVDDLGDLFSVSGLLPLLGVLLATNERHPAPFSDLGVKVHLFFARMTVFQIAVACVHFIRASVLVVVEHIARLEDDIGVPRFFDACALDIIHRLVHDFRFY